MIPPAMAIGIIATIGAGNPLVTRPLHGMKGTPGDTNCWPTSHLRSTTGKNGNALVRII